MKTSVHIIILALTVFILLGSTSCLKDYGEDVVERTLEMEQAELDKALSFFEAEGFDIDTTDLGVYYIVNDEGEGPFAKKGDTLRLEYRGTLLNGMIFDASAYYYSDSIWEFVFGELDLIPGFEDGLLLMKKGSELDLIIPSEHAYGASGNGLIGPYTTILFSTIMHDINPSAD